MTNFDKAIAVVTSQLNAAPAATKEALYPALNLASKYLTELNGDYHEQAHYAILIKNNIEKLQQRQAVAMASQILAAARVITLQK